MGRQIQSNAFVHSNCVFVEACSFPLLRVGPLRLLYVRCYLNLLSQDYEATALYLHSLHVASGLYGHTLQVRLSGTFVPGLNLRFHDLFAFGPTPCLLKFQATEITVVGEATPLQETYLFVEGLALQFALALLALWGGAFVACFSRSRH